jgi:hypothetical protein
MIHLTRWRPPSHAFRQVTPATSFRRICDLHLSPSLDMMTGRLYGS